jgi:Protein of unknown function (DUF1153)
MFVMEPLKSRPKYVIGPDGSPLTIADLPAPDTLRWVVRRKAEVIAAVRGGLLSLDEASSRYCSRWRNTFPGNTRSINTASRGCVLRAPSIGISDGLTLSNQPPSRGFFPRHATPQPTPRLRLNPASENLTGIIGPYIRLCHNSSATSG